MVQGRSHEVCVSLTVVLPQVADPEGLLTNGISKNV